MISLNQTTLLSLIRTRLARSIWSGLFYCALAFQVNCEGSGEPIIMVIGRPPGIFIYRLPDLLHPCWAQP
jgi:hypothetical protein